MENIIKSICENNLAAEQLLLEAIASDDEGLAYEAKLALIQLYGTGQLVHEGTGAIDISGFPNIQKLKAFVSKEIKDDVDVRNVVYKLYYDFIYHNFGEMPNSAEEAMEAALIAIDCSEKQDSADEGKELAKIILFWLYYNGEYESDNGYCDITCESLKDRSKAMELLRYEEVMVGGYNEKFLEMRDEGELDDFLEEAYDKYPENELLARNFVERCVIAFKVDKILEIIEAADAKLAYFIAVDLLDEWEYYFDYEDSEYTPEIIEQIWIALSDKGAHTEFLLSLYQFGRAKITNSFGEYEVFFPTLQNEEKSKAFAEKYDLELTCNEEC